MDDITGLSLLSLFFIVQSFIVPFIAHPYDNHVNQGQDLSQHMAQPPRKSAFVSADYLIYLFFFFGMDGSSECTGLFFSPVITFYDIGAAICFVTCYELIHCLAHTFNKYLLDEHIKLSVSSWYVKSKFYLS